MFQCVMFYILQLAWSCAIDSWFERMANCVEADGGFHEKLEHTDWF